VSPDDEAFLFALYGSTRAEEMTLVPWTVEQQQMFIAMQFSAQQEHYKKKYPSAQHHIIIFEGRPVGRLYVARLEQEIRIVDILLVPAERNAGIGSHLLTQLVDEGRHSGKPVRIYVENNSPSLTLFRRLGFEALEQHGIHLMLQFSQTLTQKPVKTFEMSQDS